MYSESGTTCAESSLSTAHKPLDEIVRMYVENNKSTKLGFLSKVKLPDYEHFEKTLACISIIRDLGDAKYWSHSWEHNPEESDGLLENIISAYWRHFLLWANGINEDESGHHHLMHMACRAMMLVTRYRRILTPKEHISFIEDDNIIYINNYIVNLSQITTELFTSMMLFNGCGLVNDSKSFLIASIKESLIGLVKKVELMEACNDNDNKNGIIINPYELNKADWIFYCTNLLINTCTDDLLNNELEKKLVSKDNTCKIPVESKSNIKVNIEKEKSIEEIEDSVKKKSTIFLYSTDTPIIMEADEESKDIRILKDGSYIDITPRISTGSIDQFYKD